MIERLGMQLDGIGYTIRELVHECRAEGETWREIGQALGVTTQAAWAMYSGGERDSEVPKEATTDVEH
jgi:uncharacterized NAD(P)/FAD-binding protein YdhS